MVNATKNAQAASLQSVAAASSVPSPYRIAIDLTADTLILRARHFRNIVIIVVLIAATAIGSAAITRTPEPLAGLLLWLPAGGFFSFNDDRVLNSWRSRLLLKWAESDINFSAFRYAVSRLPNLPKETLQSMLDSLLHAGHLKTEHAVSPGTRAALTLHALYFTTLRSHELAFKAVKYLIAALSILFASLTHSKWPLASCAAILLLQPLQLSLRRKKLHDARIRMIALQKLPDFNLDCYQQIASRSTGHIQLEQP